ncbi:MAG: Ig-like domain-containing protein [Peptostreptococcus sp.]|uniref:Ig-like domain-containing protein n=1 Tax=Peptostreptococcus sp. TaxID=1262 RepID=UPI002910CF19|nr:Ig-like domain-containing protein [Peptostreptococcus sp.]MDU5350187.1 Ig-like domain-containing protein [Peptostreptococcus sp.]MDU5891020.1 Ig-like domain-containing protein [Peptostreptococcus sp.]
MNNQIKRLLTMLLTLFMIITSFPLNAFAAQTETNVRNEITDIRTVGDKQVINLGNVRGEKPQLRFFSRSARLFGATTPQARSSSETVAQKVEINLNTMGLNLEEDQFDPSALTEAGSFDVKITFKELGGTRTETRTMTFQAGEIKKTETFYLPKDFGNGNVEAEIPVLKDNIALRVYVGATGTTNFNLGQDMTYKFELTQIIHPVIGLKVVDPYGKELKENINQDLGLKLALEKEHDFDLPANTKTLNIRTLTDFADNNIEDLNYAEDNLALSLTTQLDAKNKLKVGDKTYKLNKITYNALGQEVEINGQKKKVGGYIEFATQPKIIVPTPDDSGNLPKTPDGYKRLSFHAETSANAQDGRFENGEKLKVIDVLEGTEYTDTDLQNQIKGIGQPTPIIYGRNDDNKKFLKWKPELPTTGPVADTDFRPVYLADGGEITPGEKLPDGVFEVKVIKDDTIAKDDLYGKSYGVFQGSKLARDKFPDLVAEKGHQNPKWTTEAEDPTNGMVDIAKPWTKVITKATTFKATASKLPDIIENPTKPTPEGYVRVTFKAGEGVEDFKYAKIYDVKEGTALTTNHYPTAKAKVGYKDPKWSVAPGTAITSANATITATATKIEDIIPGGPEVKKPEGYYTVEFLEGKHGEFKPIKENVTEKPQVTVYYVNPEAKVKMSQITVPTVTAKVGYKFDSWSKEYQAEAVITGDRQITAVYIYVDGVSTEPKDGWTKVTLKSGTKGQFTKTTNVEGVQPKTEEFDDLVYYVDPAREVTIPAPVVKASVGNTFTGFDKSLTGTFKEETTINAKYLSTSDVIEDKTPGDDTEKPEGYVTVKFDAGQNGTFAVNSVTKFFVNPEKKVEIGAPGIDPNKNFVFTGFFNGDEKHSSAKKMYKQDVTYTAQYKDKSNESIIPGDQPKPGGWVTISFSAGEHGTFELVKGKQPTIAYHVNPEKDVVLKDKAPAIKANDGYKFTKYDPDVETARKYAKEGQVITAQYKAKVVTEDPKDAEHYAKVDFVAGDQGKFEKVGDKDQVTTFWVLKDEDVKFNAPVVTANDGFVFSGWNPALQTKYTEDKTHTAKYEPKSDISDVPVAGFQEVKFLAGTDGKFENDKTEKSVWVRPNVQVDLTTKAPKVIANKGKVHTGWKPSLIGTFTKSETATEITAQYKTDADNNGVADETETTATPTVTARNIGENPTNTTVEGKAPKGSTVTIKYTPEGGQETTKTVTANEQGKYSADITPKLEAGKEVTVTAKDGEKKVSPEVKTQVFDDKDNDGKDDKSQNFDITKADKIEMVYDPANMNYLVTSEDGKVALETKGMVVKVTDKAGVEKKFTAEEIAKDTKNFKVEPKEGTEIGLANNDKPIKVTLNVQGATKKEATTSNLSVKLDKDGNGVDDEKEQFDIKKATKVEILQNPDRMNYSVTEKAGKTPFDAKGVIIRLTDASGKTATYNYDDVIKEENKGKFTLSPADEEQIGLKEDGSVNTIPFTVTVTGADTKPSVTAKENITVILDKDGNGVDDRTETTPAPNVIARNIGKDPQKTTVEIETEPKAKVTIEYTDKDGQLKKIENLTDGKDGKLTQEITPKLKDGTDVKVTVQDGEKKPTDKTVKVFDDLDGDKIPDTKAGQTERPAALASNIGKKPTFTTITGEAEKGATVTAKVANVVVGTAIADSKTGKYTIEAKQNEKPIKEGVKIDVTATLAPKTESLKQTVVVFNDTDETGQPDSAKDFDVKKAKEMQVVASPDKMVYSNGDKLNLDGLKVLVTDVNGNKKIFTYRHADNTEFTKAGLSVDLKQGTELSSKDYNAQTAKDGHNGRKLVVTLDTTGNTQVTEAITGQTPTALTVNKKQSAQPTDVVAANQGDATVTKVKGKATKDAVIKITDDNGQSLLPEGTTVKANDQGDFTADLNKLLNPGTKVFVTATEPGKSESPKAETTVIRDKDGNWEADTGSKLSTPVIDPIREKDEKVVVAAPKADDKIQTIEVSDQNGKTVTLTKDPADTTGKTWIVEGSDQAEKVVENNEGKLEIPVKDKLPLNDRDQIKVTFKDGEKPANEAFDKAPVQKASQTPKVDPVYTGEKEVKIVDPTVADPTAKTIKVKVGENDTMVIEKQADNSWKVKNNPNANVVVKDGKVIVPLEDKAKKDDVIMVSTINDSKIESPAAEVRVVDKELTNKPTINRANKDENSVSGTAAPNAEVTVTVTPKGGEPKTFTGKADGDGNFKVTTDPLVDGDTVVVKASEPGKADNTSDPKVVGVDTSKLKDSIDKAEDPTIGGKDGANLKPDENKVDKELKEALDKAKEVKEKGDNGDSNTDQKAVDKAKEDLDKAIAQKEADTAVDKAKDNPTPENIKDAQDKIDAIPGSKDPKAKDYNPIKKDLQDKLDLIKIIKEAEKETQKEGYKDKPTQDKTALEKAIADGKENLKNNTKITESTNTIQEKLNIIRMERIVVGVDSLAVGIKTLKIKTSVPGATVKIKIDGVLIDTIKTDAYGTFSKGLEAAIQEDQEIVLEASKPGYNDGNFKDNVY